MSHEYHINDQEVHSYRLVPSSDPPWPVHPATLCQSISNSCGHTHTTHTTVSSQPRTGHCVTAKIHISVIKMQRKSASPLHWRALENHR